MHGYTAHKDDVLKRLRRLEDHVRALQRMVEEETYCIDVLTRLSAATEALRSFGLAVLEDHLNSCVAAAVAEGGDGARDKVDEASRAIARMVRS
ncbi:metal-sensitive transcriptional regulator [Streptomyces sp. NPDC006512]|uniref:metal-sensitive transcriptional regulator n=1 Tax=Streptomyces sp. NPDC006512 TaxID=3154307 RepID=UPI0033B50747